MRAVPIGALWAIKRSSIAEVLELSLAHAGIDLTFALVNRELRKSLV
jgi:hypothetical protein